MLVCCYLISAAIVGFVAFGIIVTGRPSPVSLLSPDRADSDNGQTSGQIRAV